MPSMIKLRRLSSRLVPRRSATSPPLTQPSIPVTQPSVPLNQPSVPLTDLPLTSSPTPSLHNGSTHSLSTGSSASPTSTPALTSPATSPDPSQTNSPRSSQDKEKVETLRSELISGAKQLFFKRHIGALACLALTLTIDRAIIPEHMAHVPTATAPSDMLSQSIAIAKMLVNAGEAAPVPYVKSAAGLILGILEPIKLYQKNLDDHNELIDKIGTIVTMMKDLALDPDSPPQSPKIKENLDQFRNSMSAVIQDLHTTMQGYSIPQQLWKTYSIGEWLKKSEQVIDELRMNRLVESSMTTHMYAREIHNLVVPMLAPNKRSGSPQLTSSLTESELGDYARLVPGDIALIETCHTPFGIEVDFEEVDVDNSIVRVRDVYKTGRFYKGDKAEKGPNIIQLYGVCSSALRPALIFHDELHSISVFEKRALFLPMHFIQWTFYMLLDYDSAYSYLRAHAPNACVNHPRPPARMYYTGCPCAPNTPHSFRIEAFVNSKGKLHLSIHTDLDTEPPNIHRPGYRSCKELTPIPRSIVGKIFSPPSQGLPRSGLPEFTKKDILSGFHSILLSLGYASETFRIPVSSSSGREPIAFGEIFETEPCEILDEICGRQPKASLGLSIPLGRIVFPRNIRPTPRYVDPGVQWEHPGATFKDMGDKKRFTVTRFKGNDMPDVNCSCSIQMMDIYARGAAWLAQIHSMRSKITSRISNPNSTISMTTDATFLFSYQSSFGKDNNEPQIEKVYLFVQNLTRSANGSVSAPGMYWSTDLSGAERMNEETMDRLGLTLPKLEMVGEGVCWSPKQLTALWDLHMDLGFDPDTDEVALFLDPYRVVANFEPAQSSDA